MAKSALPAAMALASLSKIGQMETDPTPKWIRATLDGKTVADSKKAHLVRQKGTPAIPRTYAFPPDDIDLDAIPRSARREIDGHIAIDWDSMDHWYEEAEEVFVHPRDPHNRIDTLFSSRHVIIERDGERLAESRRPVLLFERDLPVRFYLPHDDINMSRLRTIDRTTKCPYKGEAYYYAVKAGGRDHEGLAWSYLTPLREVEPIRGLICFFNERVDIIVDGERQKRPKSPFN
jgi:uncharacterized protein (DUF427 family)